MSVLMHSIEELETYPIGKVIAQRPTENFDRKKKSRFLRTWSMIMENARMYQHKPRPQRTMPATKPPA
jgi:hypothetical protein